jgi:hypothetical protein
MDESETAISPFPIGYADADGAMLRTAIKLTLRRR